MKGKKTGKAHWGSIYCFIFNIIFLLPILAEGSLYDKLFPLYVQTCAPIQTKKKDKFSIAGPVLPVLYIKGMCQDKTAPYPRVQLCQSQVDLTDPKAGTLIRVNRSSKNMHWIALEGNELGFHTGISHIQNRINSGQTAICSRIPIVPTQLPKMVDYLNQVNENYSEINHLYGINNRYASVIQNTLAAAGIESPASTHLPWLRVLFDPRIPTHLILSHSKKAKLVPDVLTYYRNPQIYRTLVKHGRPPIPYGTVFETFPMQSYDNSLFDLKSTLIKDFLNYTLALRSLKPITQLIQEEPKLDTKDFDSFYIHYLSWLNKTIKEITEKLTTFD